MDYFLNGFLISLAITNNFVKAIHLYNSSEHDDLQNFSFQPNKLLFILLSMNDFISNVYDETLTKLLCQSVLHDFYLSR